MSTTTTTTTTTASVLQLEQYIDNSDIEFEQQLQRNRFVLKTWLHYVDHKRAQVHKAVSGTEQHDRHMAALNMIYERAVASLPGSYKLWKMYLDERVLQVANTCITDPLFEHVNRVYERSLHYMHKMPVIWLDYLRFLLKQRLYTQCRRTFDRALQSLPLTQHDRLWKFATDELIPTTGIKELGIHLFERYLQFDPSQRDRFINYLIQVGEYDRAALDLHRTIDFSALEREEFRSSQNAKAWLRLSQLIQDYPTDITLINVGRVLRSGLKMKETVQQHGMLWCALATYYIQMGHFEKARDIYEEALLKVNTVADFSQVFDAYAQFEEQLISIKMVKMEGDDGNAELDGSAVLQTDAATATGTAFTDSDDLDLRFARLEHLMVRRPFLLSSVKLRQNPHNVHEWHKRVKLFLAEDDYEQVVKTYLQAVDQMDPQKAVGKPHTIWCAFAKYYEFKLRDLDSARMIFERAVQSNFRSVDELASVWCEYVEMELRNKNYNQARALLQRATMVPSQRVLAGRRDFYDVEPAAQRVHKSVKLWSLYLDVEESLGTVESTIALYDRCMSLKVATVPLVINYANFLHEHRYYEHAFKTLERAVNIFPYPQVYHVWIHYLVQFMNRYRSERIERARDLFEEAVRKVPQEYARGMYLLYAKLEEDHGLVKHAMAIYDRATRAVKPEERYELFLIYIARASEYYGVTRTREIYEKAIRELPDRDVPRICLLYARLERQLGEIDRARAIYAHGCRLVNPASGDRRDNGQDYWKAFEAFEEAHGNVETYKDFLRLRRAVQSSWSTANLSSVAMEKAQAEFEERRRILQEERRQRQRQEALQRRIEMEHASSADDQGGEEADDDDNEEEISIELAPIPDSVFVGNVRR